MINGMDAGAVALMLFYMGFEISNISTLFNCTDENEYDWGGRGDTIVLYMNKKPIVKVSLSQRSALPLD